MDNTQAIAVRARPRRSWRSSLLTRPLPVVALLWVLALVAATVAAPILAPADPIAQDLADTLSGPSADHLLGTDRLGRDILSRILYGGQVSLVGVLIATGVAAAVGTLSGVLAGYYRGVADSLLTAVADILMSIPTTVILLSIAAVVARDQTILMATLGLLLSTFVYRVVRAGVLDVRNELFVTAARTSGLGDARILATHIVPRIGALIVVQITIVASVATVIQLGLGFLGIDVAPPQASWGSLLRDASTTAATSIWQLVPPTVVVGVTVLALSVIGESVQQSLTDRTRRHDSPLARRRGASRAHTAKQEAAIKGPLIVAEGLTIAVPLEGGAVTLVDDVSFRIAPGEVVALVGESGAGKSVTARALLGLLPAGAETRGRLRVGSTDVLQASSRELRAIRGKQIAYISQEPMASLSPSFRVGAQLVEIIRTHRGGSRAAAERVALELLDAVEIVDARAVMRKFPHELSGGMAQRVVIAIALAGEPKVLVADEPTTALDVSVQMQILELLRNLQRTRSLAVLFVTHDWGVVADICDRAVVMYAGQVVEDAAVETVFSAPRHPYSAALRGADLHGLERHTRLATIEGQVPAPGDWPRGCRFASRCAFAQARCRVAAIPLEAVTETHRVRCIRTDELGPIGPGVGAVDLPEVTHD